MQWPKLSERTKDRCSVLVRFIVIFPMISLGSQLYLWTHTLWAEHWLRKDGITVPAIVAQMNPKRLLDYSYTVNGKDYNGKDRRNWEDDRDHPAARGDKITAIVSTSHPAFSVLDVSRSAWGGLPIAVVVFIFELFLLAILLDGILRLFFGIQIHTGQPEDSLVVLIFAGAFTVVLLLATFGLWRNRRFRLRLTRR